MDSRMPARKQKRSAKVAPAMSSEGEPPASPIHGSSSSSSAPDVACTAVDLQDSTGTAPDAAASAAHKTATSSSGNAVHTSAPEAVSCAEGGSHGLQPPEQQASTAAHHSAGGAAHQPAPEPAGEAAEAAGAAEAVPSGTGQASEDQELVSQRIQQQWAMRTSAAQPFPTHESSASASLRQSLLSHHHDTDAPPADSSSSPPLRQSTDAALRASAVGQRLGHQASEQAQFQLRGSVDVPLRGSAAGLPLAQPAIAIAAQLRSSVAATDAEPPAPGLPVLDSQQAAAGYIGRHTGHMASVGQAAAPVSGGEATSAEQQQRSMPAGGVPAAAGLQMQPLDVSIIHMTPLVVEGKPIYPGLPVTEEAAAAAAAAAKEKACECTVGWMFFALGFLFPFVWVAACFVPLCSKRLNDKRAAKWSAVALLVYVPVAYAYYFKGMRGLQRDAGIGGIGADV